MSVADSRLRRCLLVMAACLAMPLWAASPACERALLEDLGWRFEEVRDGHLRIQAGMPCERANLAEAQAAGDLLVRVPASLDAQARARLHAELLAMPATTCAFAFRLGAATRTAVDKLVANPGFRFSWLQVGWIGFGPTGSARDGWKPITAFGRGYIPRAGNWKAIQGFYRGQVRAECGVGRQVAQFAAQAELFGPQGFDAVFKPEEITIGTWHVLNRSGGILQGAAAGVFTRDGQASKASAQGRQAFMGVPGFIQHVFDAAYLDDIHNQAENFVVYDIDDAAAEALRRNDGFAHYTAQARLLWELSRGLPRSGSRYFERLLFERDNELRAGLFGAQRNTLEKMDAILADPFFTGMQVYVHRQGVKPVGYHFVRLLDRNPRTPFKIEFALHNVHTTLMQRWMGYRLQACAATAGGETLDARYSDYGVK